MHDRREPERILQRLASFAPLRCAQCGRFSDRSAAGWRAYRTDLPQEAELEDPTAADLPAGAIFRPGCAELESTKN